MQTIIKIFSLLLQDRIQIIVIYSSSTTNKDNQFINEHRNSAVDSAHFSDRPLPSRSLKATYILFSVRLDNPWPRYRTNLSCSHLDKALSWKSKKGRWSDIWYSCKGKFKGRREEEKRKFPLISSKQFPLGVTAKSFVLWMTLQFWATLKWIMPI